MASWHFLVTVFVMALGMSLQGGYFTCLYTIPQDVIEQFINQSIYLSWNQSLTQLEVSTVWSTISSSNQAGKVIASVLAPFVLDKIGRKWSIILSSFVSSLGILLQFLARPTEDIILLAAGRVISGLYTGLIAVAIPLYLVEVAITPVRRGSITRIHNVITLCGSVLALFVGLPEFLGTPDRWNYLPIVPLPVMVIGSLWLLMVPETPMYILQRGRKDSSEVKRSLYYYLGEEAKNFDVSYRLGSAKKSDGPNCWTSLWKSCKDPKQKKLIILWFMLALECSFSGTGPISNYMTSMIARTPTYDSFDRYVTFVMSIIRIFVFLLAVYVINKVGRRPLFLTSLWIVATCITALSIMALINVDSMAPVTAKWFRIVFLFVWSCLQYVATSTGTLIVSETASQNMRALSLGIYKTTYHASGVFITFAFAPLFQLSEAGSYLFLSIPASLIGIYLMLACPETKSIEFIEEATETKPLLKNRINPNGYSK